MRTTARPLTGTVLAVAAAVGLGMTASGAYAAGDGAALEIFPATAEPGTSVTVNTTACGSNGYAQGDARSLGVAEFRLTPGTHKEVVVGKFTIPEGAAAGTYTIEARCKNGKHSKGELTVRDHKDGGGSDGRQHEEPSGYVKSGLGGSVGPDTTKIAAGTAILAAAAVGGTLLLRRRARDAQGN
jgi:hypothetical protein